MRTVRLIAIAALLAVVVGSLGGCSSVYAPTQVTPGEQQTIQEGAQFLNELSDPALPDPVFQDCWVDDWKLKGTTSQNKNTFDGRAGGRCAGRQTRNSGMGAARPGDSK